MHPAKRQCLKLLDSDLAFMQAVLAATIVGRSSASPQTVLPNPIVQAHTGRSVRFYDDLCRGKIVILNMMYTVCTEVCPPNTAALLQV